MHVWISPVLNKAPPPSLPPTLPEASGSDTRQAVIEGVWCFGFPIREISIAVTGPVINMKINLQLITFSVSDRTVLQKLSLPEHSVSVEGQAGRGRGQEWQSEEGKRSPY